MTTAREQCDLVPMAKRSFSFFAPRGTNWYVALVDWSSLFTGLPSQATLAALVSQSVMVVVPNEASWPGRSCRSERTAPKYRAVGSATT